MRIPLFILVAWVGVCGAGFAMESAPSSSADLIRNVTGGARAAPGAFVVNGMGTRSSISGPLRPKATQPQAPTASAIPVQAAAPPRKALERSPTAPVRSAPASAGSVARGSLRPRPAAPAKKRTPPAPPAKPASVSLDRVLSGPTGRASGTDSGPRVTAKALYCVDCTDNSVVLAKNTSAPLPIASITKLLTAMTVLEGMNLDQVLDTPKDIKLVQRHRVGIRPGDRFTVRDLLHGMLIESGNDCAEALARSYPKGGWSGFMRAMNEKAHAIGAQTARVYTPSGLDLNIEIGRRLGKPLIVKKSNIASAEDVALIARKAFTDPLIREISSMKTYTMVTKNGTPREYPLHSNDKLLDKSLPVTGAKTGYTDLAGRCIVAMFNDVKKAKDYVVVVLNSPSHFKTAEKVYHWICNP